MKGISRREFARRDGCSEKLVRKALSRGALVAFEDGSIDASLVGTPWRRTADQGAAAAADPDADRSAADEAAAAPGELTFVQAQRVKENYLAKLRQLEFEIKSGRVCDLDTAERQVFALARGYRDAVYNWPARVAPLIAAELDVDQTRLAQALEKHLHDLLAVQAGAGPLDIAAQGKLAARPQARAKAQRKRVGRRK